MCVLCASAGKAPGDFGCVDAAPAGDDNSGGKISAPQPDSGPSNQSSGTDTVAGSPFTSSTLSIDAAIRGTVNTSGDQDWYRVDLVAGQQYTFALNGFGVGAIQNPELRLFDAFGAQVALDEDSGPIQGARLTFTASASGTYYVSASGHGNGTGQYMVTMNDGATPFIPVVTVQDAADYLTNTYWEVNGLRDRYFGSSTVSFNVDGLETERASLARTALQLWSDVAGLSFVETHGAADIMFDDTQAGAYSSSIVTGAGIISSSSINVETGWYGGIDAIDSYAMQTFIHEIGHAIGLGHAGAYNGAASYGVDNIYANDTWQTSVMSYMAQSNFAESYRFTMTPMMADILAVQEIYGAASTRTGDTVYGFGSTAGAIYNFANFTTAPALTIYDTSGTDTLNASGYAQDQIIDLRPGSFSDIGGLSGNIGIFLTAVIENAVGGSGNDTIIGNGANNTIKGGAGNDTIDGGAGTDSAVFTGLRASYTITALGGTSVRVAGTDGTDTLTDVELLVFEDQTVNWTAGGLPDLDAVNLHLSASTVMPGGSTTVSYTVTNAGAVAAGASTVGIYLSADATFGGDTLLTTRAIPTLNAGMSFNDSFALSFPTAGTYYVFAVADHNGAIVESNESNESNNPANGVLLSVAASMTVNGSSANDTLTGGAGNDSINGGGGDDTVVFSRSLGEYAVQDFGTRIVISGPDGSDTLTGVEHLRFSNGTVHVNDGNTLFDTLYYMRTNLDVFEAGANALDHFKANGWHEGRDPNPFFDTVAYAGAHRDALKGMNPLDYYHNIGWKLGDDPSPNFDTKLYLLHNPDVAASGVDPLEHFLQFGRGEGRQAYDSIGASKLVGGFDAEYYMFSNPDVAASGVDPLWHFNTFGWHEGRNPNAFFDTEGYLAHYADVASSGVNPLWHYENFGWKEGRDPSATFDTNGYLAANPDVAAGQVNPLDHYLLNGIYEGRTAISDMHWQT